MAVARVISSRYYFVMSDQSPRPAEKIATLLDRLSRVSREMQFVHGLNPAQWEALRFIAAANRYSRTPGALADYLGSTKGTVSQTLIALETKGLIQRVRSKTDKRRVTLQVTPAGQDLVDRDPIHDIVHAASALDPALREDVVTGLESLLEALQNRQGAKRFGVCCTCGLYIASPSEPCSERQRCGLTGDPIAQSEVNRVCVNFSRKQQAP